MLAVCVGWIERDTAGAGEADADCGGWRGARVRAAGWRDGGCGAGRGRQLPWNGVAAGGDCGTIQAGGCRGGCRWEPVSERLRDAQDVLLSADGRRPVVPDALLWIGPGVCGFDCIYTRGCATAGAWRDISVRDGAGGGISGERDADGGSAGQQDVSLRVAPGGAEWVCSAGCGGAGGHVHVGVGQGY